MTDYEKDSTELLSKCIDIIEAETKPLKRKVSDKARAWREVGKLRDSIEIQNLLANTDDVSDLIAMGKEFD